MIRDHRTSLDQSRQERASLHQAIQEHGERSVEDAIYNLLKQVIHSVTWVDGVNETARRASQDVIAGLTAQGFMILHTGPATPQTKSGVLTTDTVEQARQFAILHHGAQRYGEHPYAYHLDKVVTVLQETGYTAPVLLAAGWLHDVVEDTGVNIIEIEETFGREVRDLVWACSGFGENRKARNANIYEKIALSGAARILKTADRVANLENSIKEAPSLCGMYVKEHDAFYAVVTDSLGPMLRQRFLRAQADAINVLKEVDPQLLIRLGLSHPGSK